MRVLFLFIAASLLWSCQNDSASKTVDTANETVQEIKEPEETVLTNTYCFRSYFGEDPNYKDTTRVNLVIIGEEVTGTYDWIPAGKDSARGTLTGTMKGKIITAIYNYVIEGSNQKEEMVFKMELNQLLVKKGELTEVDGVLKLKNPEEATFSEVIPRVICK